MARIESEAARVGGLVEQLLLLARLDELPEMQMVPVDVVDLRQVLANLTRNAVIHSAGDSSIEVTVRRRDGTAVIVVRDHGQGLPAGGERRVFERFWRAEGGRSRGPGGAGGGGFGGGGGARIARRSWPASSNTA